MKYILNFANPAMLCSRGAQLKIYIALQNFEKLCKKTVNACVQLHKYYINTPIYTSIPIFILLDSLEKKISTKLKLQ